MKVADPLEALLDGSAQIWVVLIGINSYQDKRLPDLQFAVQDCRGLESAIRDVTERFPETKIFPYCGTESSPVFHSEVSQAIQYVVNEAQPADTVVFYFAGHGELDRNTQKLYLCSSETNLDELEYTGVSIDSLVDGLKSSSAHKQVLILDTCHSGGAVARGRSATTLARSSDDVAQGNQADEPTFEPDPHFAPQLQAALDYQGFQGKDYCALLSCSPHQKSWELPGNIEHGAFTYALIEGLRHTGDRQDQGKIEIDRLSKWARDYTQQLVEERWGEVQIPGRILSGHGDIVIGMQTHDPFTPPKDVSQMTMQECEDCYELTYRQILFEEYPTVHDLSRTKLDELARKLLIGQAEQNRLEERIQQRYEVLMQRYMSELTNVIYQQGQLKEEDCKALQEQCGVQNIGFSDETLAKIYARSYQSFQNDRQAYAQRYAQALRQSGELIQRDRNDLRELQTELNLGDAIVREIGEQENQRFEQDRQNYRQACLALYRDTGCPIIEARQQLQDLRDRYQLGVTPDKNLAEQAYAIFSKEAQRYQDQLLLELYQQGELRADLLQRWQAEYGFGDRLSHQIEAVVRQQFADDCKTYEDLYQNDLYEDGEVNRVVLQQKQSELKLGATVVDDIAQRISQRFQEDCQEYRNADFADLHEDGQRDQIRLAQLQHHYGLGGVVVQAITEDVNQQFQAHFDRYETAYQRDLYSDGDVEQSVLLEMQEQCYLGTVVVEAIAQSIQQQFHTHQEEYRKVLSQQLHEQGQSDISRLTKLQEELKLGSYVVTSISDEVQIVFDDHCDQFRAAIAQQLRETGDLDSEAIENLQVEKGLGSPVADQIIAEESDRAAQETDTYSLELRKTLHQTGSEESASLQKLQQQLGFRETVIQHLHQQERERFTQNKREYRRLFANILCNTPDVTFSEADTARLAELQHQRGISEAVAKAIRDSYIQDLEQYRNSFINRMLRYDLSQQQRLELSDQNREELERERLQLDLEIPSRELAERDAETEYRQQLAQYDDAVEQLIYRCGDSLQSVEDIPESDRLSLNQLRQDLGLLPPIATAIELRLIEGEEISRHISLPIPSPEPEPEPQVSLEQKQTAYRNAVSEAIARAYPFSAEDRIFLDNLKLSLSLSAELAQEIEAELQPTPEPEPQSLAPVSPSPTSSPTKPTSSTNGNNSRASSQKRLVAGGVVVGAIGAIALGYVFTRPQLQSFNDIRLVTQPQRNALNNERLEQAQAKLDEEDFEGAIALASQIPEDAPSYSDAQEVLGQTYLDQARQLSATSYVSAIEKLGEIPSGTQAHEESQQVKLEWATEIGRVAQEYYNLGELQSAINVANEVPEVAENYQTIQEELTQWQGELNSLTDAQSARDAARQAESDGNWQDAIEHWEDAIENAYEIPQDVPYWDDFIVPILQEARETLNPPAQAEPPVMQRDVPAHVPPTVPPIVPQQPSYSPSPWPPIGSPEPMPAPPPAIEPPPVTPQPSPCPEYDPMCNS